jgi:thiol-disulfide isomerase/thioredoxin
MRARSAAVLLAVLAVLGLLVYGLASKGEAKLTIGEPVPDRELPRLDRPGETRAIADYRGKWVLVNAWASWCDPCRTESPALQRYFRQHREDDFVVIGLNVQDNERDALEFIEDPDPDQKADRLTYPQLRSVGDERSRAFGMTGVPESFLVDPEGRIALIRRGPVDREYLDRFVTPEIRGT